ncbi:hypothetical protein TIFTF001_009408 [Ficus carica]|uniref:Uncharacterized protein n=1 Tax=Ficus carica TaxID=3494 RepID=A0AA88CYY5_FICCA|nr:hypothetical protein TIFTF001_009408 [Ficus carica]
MVEGWEEGRFPSPGLGRREGVGWSASGEGGQIWSGGVSPTSEGGGLGSSSRGEVGLVGVGGEQGSVASVRGEGLGLRRRRGGRLAGNSPA